MCLWNPNSHGKAFKKGCWTWFKWADRAAPVLQPRAAIVFPHFWAKSRGIMLAVNGHKVSKSCDSTAVCALDRFLVLASLTKVNWAEKNCYLYCVFFFPPLFFSTKLKTWCFKRTEHSDLMVSHNSICPVTCLFPRKNVASSAAGELSLPCICSAPNQSNAKGAGEQLKQLEEMGGGNRPTTKLIFELIKACMVWGLWSNKQVQICQRLKKKSN